MMPLLNFNSEKDIARVAVAVIMAICVGGSTPVEGQTCQIQREPVVRLGALNDAVSIGVPYAVSVGRLSDVGWVVAEDGRGVLHYSNDGSYRGLLSRRGEGPEELRSPRRLAVDATDSLWVTDGASRVVVFAADGTPARTLQIPTAGSAYTIDGFTSSGHPYGHEYLIDQGGVAMLDVRVLTREGERLYSIGSVTAEERDALRTFPIARPPQSLSLADSVFIVPAGGTETWLVRWTRGYEQSPFTTGDAVWQALGFDRPPASGEGRPLAVVSDQRDGFWLLGAVRMRSREEQDALIEAEARRRRASTLGLEIRYSDHVRDAVFDGALLHISGDGTPTSALIFDEYAWGFGDSEHYYTVRETEVGLLQIELWRFIEVC